MVPEGEEVAVSPQANEGVASPLVIEPAEPAQEEAQLPAEEAKEPAPVEPVQEQPSEEEEEGSAFEQLETSRYFPWPGAQTSRS